MTDHATIATLPINPYDASPPMDAPTLVETENPVLGVVNYSDKSFIVFGEATRTYKEQLRDLGGKYNGRLKERTGFVGGAAWLFYNNLRANVYNFVNQVNDGGMNHHEGIPQQGEQIALPTVIAPIKNKTYQFVKWKVYIPTEGMSVTIKAGGSASTGKVIQTETHRNFVDTVYINLGENTSKLVICNGLWQVWGYMVEHSVFFGEKKGPVAPPTTVQQPDYNFQDIAGI